MKKKLHENVKGLYLTLLSFLFLFFFNPCSILAQFSFEKIEDHGNDENRMVWVIMGDGYTSLELDYYYRDVDNIIHEFFSTSPWAEYKNFINIYRIDVVSNESGADHPSSNIYVDTALDATYDTYGIGRLLTVNDAKAFDIASSIPSFDAVMVIVNDGTYGGSGGATMVFSNHEKSGRIALHEAGHLIADLADEYETPYPGYPEGDSEPNVTYQTELEYIPWKSWIESGTPLPTPETGGDFGVGIYEGARYRSTGIYRPTYNSIMRSLGSPYGPINSEAVVINLYNYVDPIDKHLPDANNLLSSSDYSVSQFKIELVNPESEGLGISWEIDGIILEKENSTTLSVDASILKQGSHSIKVLVAEYTPLVRNDPQELLFSSRTWSLEKASASGIISGRVVNSLNNHGIEGVEIKTYEGEYSTITDVDGSYQLSAVSEGIYTIISSSERYSSFSKSTIEVIDGEITTVNISLDPLFDTHSISGYIRGDVKEGISINLKKGDDIFLSLKTNADGSYLINGLGNGTFTVIPSLSKYTFNPPLYELLIDDEDFTGINFEALSQSCPAQEVLEDQSSSLNLLRKLRNEILAKHELGREYTNLYYKHAPEMTSLIITHEEIREDVSELILDIIPEIKLLIEGEYVILRTEVIDEVENFFNTLESYARPEFRKTIKKMIKDIRKKNFLSTFGVTRP